MVFLTSIDILDTGFLSKSSRSSQLATSERVNNGSALRLKGVEMNLEVSSNLDSETFTGEFGDVACPLISVNPDTFTMTLYLNSNNTTTSNVWGVDDMGALGFLRRLPKTKGFKAIYYPVSANVRNRDKQMIWEMGTPDTTESQGDINITLAATEASTAGTSGFDLTAVNYIAVRFNSCSITQESGSSKIVVKLSGVITA
jgi:hypothetical protein